MRRVRNSEKEFWDQEKRPAARNPEEGKKGSVDVLKSFQEDRDLKPERKNP